MPRQPRQPRTKEQRIRDRRRIGDLYLQGWLQVDIAEEVGVSQATVSNDLKTLHKDWLESALIDFNEAKSRELSKLDRLEREYWKGWLRSCQDEETVITKTEEGGEEIKSSTTHKRKGQAGDHRFLDGVEKCVRQRCKILGVEAPEKKEHDVGPKLASVLSALPDDYKAGVLAALSQEMEGEGNSE